MKPIKRFLVGFLWYIDKRYITKEANQKGEYNMKYFIADPHFGHMNILRLSNRPFNTIQEHDDTLIKNWNNAVKPTDEIYILGDLTMSKDGKYANSLLSKLNGRKYLIIGNHENYLNDPEFDKSQYVWIKDYYEFNYETIKFVLFHYPILEWNGYFKKSIHLYGHVHNTRQPYFESIMDKRAKNVGVDIINYTPISIDAIIDNTDFD